MLVKFHLYKQIGRKGAKFIATFLPIISRYVNWLTMKYRVYIKKYNKTDPRKLGKAISKTVFDKLNVSSNFIIAKFPITGALELMKPVFKKPPIKMPASPIIPVTFIASSILFCIPKKLTIKMKINNPKDNFFIISSS